jgi:hypothetical protein
VVYTVQIVIFPLLIPIKQATRRFIFALIDERGGLPAFSVVFCSLLAFFP